MTAYPRLLLLILLIVGWTTSAAASPHGTPGNARAEALVRGLDRPWGMAFLPDGDILITERTGAVRVVRDGRLLKAPVAGVPEVAVVGQGGLLDIALHPEFADNRWVYLSYSAPADGGQGTAVGRGRWNGKALQDWRELFRLPRATRKGHHFGSRLVFDAAGHLFVSIGDRGQRGRAQDTADPAGSILRLNADGSIPADNPFVGTPDFHPAIWSYGHRNPQGMTRHPRTGALWENEHGPQGGDEINIVRPGINYGWPAVTYGREYGTGFKIGETSAPGIAQPVHYWVPSIAPSGMAFYTADRFPQWRHNLFIGSMKFGYLVRLVVNEQGQVLQEQRLLENQLGRIRDVRQGPDGFLYVLTDSNNGGLYRVSP